jgi:hypothetical protein
VFWGVLQPYNESSNGIDVPFFSTGISNVVPGVRLVPLDDVVSLAVQENMYVVICLMAWTGWHVPPQWAFPSMSHAGNNQVWGSEVLGSPSLEGYTAIINGTAAKERTGLINTWRFIANRYRDIPNVIFELLNEPMVSDSSLGGASYKVFNEQIISAIESVEMQPHLKLIEPLRDSTWLEITKGWMDVSKPDVVWASHLYVPWSSYNPNGRYWRNDSFTWHGKYFLAGWGNGTTFVAWSLIRIATQVHSWNRPWINSEFSKKVSETYWKDWFETALSTMAEQNVASWFYFVYDRNTAFDSGWNIGDPSTRQAIMPILQQYLGPSTTISSVAISTITTTASGVKHAKINDRTSAPSS